MPSEDDLYQLSLKAYRDNKNTMDYAVKVAAEAARQEALQQVIQQGFQQGRIAAAIEFARKMKMKNMPVEQITELTGLTREEIEKL